MKRGDFEIELTDEIVDVKLDASAGSPHAKLGALIFVTCGTLLMDVVLLVLSGKHGGSSMWHDITAAKSLSDATVPLVILLAGTAFVAWLGFRWATAAWPSDEHFHSDRTTLTVTRVPWLDFKNHEWKTSSFPLTEVSQICFAVYASAKGSSIYGVRFSVSGKRHKVLPGLEAPEAQKILAALQRLGADVILDKKLQKQVDAAMANRYGEPLSTS